MPVSRVSKQQRILRRCPDQSPVRTGEHMSNGDVLWLDPGMQPEVCVPLDISQPGSFDHLIEVLAAPESQWSGEGGSVLPGEVLDVRRARSALSGVEQHDRFTEGVRHRPIAVMPYRCAERVSG